MRGDTGMGPRSISPHLQTSTCIHPKISLLLKKRLQRLRGFRLLLAGELGADPRAGSHPIALRGPQRDAQSLGGLLLAQPREEPALDGPRQAFVPLAKEIEGAIEIQKPLGLRVASNALLVELHRHFAATPLRGEAGAGPADDDLTHRAGGYGEEMSAVGNAHPLLTGELEIRLVHETGGIERGSTIGASQVISGNPPELVVHERYQPIESFPIAASVGVQELSDLTGLGHSRRTWQDIAPFRGIARREESCYHPAIMLKLLLWTTLLTPADEKAVQIADQMMDALGGQENWEDARYVRFTNFRRDRRTTFTWDRYLGRLRIDGRTDAGEPFVILMNINSQQGSAYVDGRELEGEELSEYLTRGNRMWPGATYWFLMPLKWKDPGVKLSYEGKEEIDGTVYDTVHLTFDNVGRSPGDEYWAYINPETHLMDYWKFKLQGGFEGTYHWTGWERHGGVLVATERQGNDEVIRFENIYIGESIPEKVFTSPEPVEFP